MKNTKAPTFHQTLTALALVSLVILFFSACSHGPTVATTCQELDWYELGRQDGAKGPKARRNERTVTAHCADSDTSLNEALYHNGFDAGVAHYCTPQNGFELGRSGQPAADICPPLTRAEFLAQHKRGVRFSQIETTQIEIESRLNHLDAQLSDNSLDIARRGLISGEKLELLEKKKQLTKERAQLGGNGSL